MKGVALCRSNRQEEAIKIFDLLLQAEATELDVVLTNKGNAFGELGNWHAALACYERAISVNPNYAPAQRQLAWIMNRLHQGPEPS
jgi:tetratricopeptide (TPR) repeat protein